MKVLKIIDKITTPIISFILTIPFLVAWNYLAFQPESPLGGIILLVNFVVIAIACYNTKHKMLFNVGLLIGAIFCSVSFLPILLEN